MEQALKKEKIYNFPNLRCSDLTNGAASGMLQYRLDGEEMHGESFGSIGFLELELLFGGDFSLLSCKRFGWTAGKIKKTNYCIWKNIG